MRMHPAYRTRSGLSDWAEEVLSRRVYAVLSTVNRDGSTHSVPVGFLFDDERFVIQSGSGTRKVRNIERVPRVRVLVQSPPETMGADGWVAADGRAHIVVGEEGARLSEAATARYLTAEGKAAYGDALAPVLDVAIVVVPERWQMWTDSMMFEPLLDQGYTEEEIASWFLPRDR